MDKSFYEEGETQRTLMKTIVLNTLEGGAVSEQIGTLIKGDEVEVLNTSDKRIAHCMGCNMCWLKTPGVCAIKDDYEGISLIRALDS